MAEKHDDPTTPTGESPVYDSLVEPPEPEKAPETTERDSTVEATVEPEHSAPVSDEPLPEEPEEIVVADSTYVDEGNQTAVIEDTTPAAAPVRDEPLRDEPYRDEPKYVYVNNPVAPVKKNNRGFGVLVGFISTVVFAVLLFIVMAIVYASYSGALTLAFIGQTSFYVPALFFLVGFIVLAVIVNRGGWWLYVIGSVFVALFVYFGTVAALLIGDGLVLKTSAEAAELFRTGLANPFTIASALVAREVAVWAGALVSRRGRRVKTRNSEALDDYMREKAAARQQR